MPRLVKRLSRKVGVSPGTLIHVGEKKVEKARITMIDYNQDEVHEKEVATIEESLPFKERPSVTWVNVDGVHEVEIIEQFGRLFDIHPLALEDIVNTGQRPKMEDFGDYIYIVLRMLTYDEEGDEIKSEQVSLILGPGYVVSFQESAGDVFEPVRARIRSGKGRIRKMDSDYLAYALIDAIVDHYFVVLEKLGETIEFLEEDVVLDPTQETLQIIHKLRGEIIFLRKSVWPLREVVGSLERGESPLVHEATAIFLRDLYDHTIRVAETAETFRDTVSGMFDIYLSSVSNRMNEVMKVLTVIATIFIPLTFIAGVYGMNFKYMPELEWRWGYFAVWGVMIALGVGMLILFRRRKWL